jgi:aconitate hydratase
MHMTAVGQDSLNTRSTLNVGGRSYAYYSLAKAAEQLGDVSRLPFSMKVLLENLLRFEDGVTVTRADIQAIVDWLGRQGRDLQGDPVSPGARADAGFHRRALRRRSRRDARCDHQARRRSGADQSAGARPPRHRSLGDGRRIRHPQGARAELALEYQRNIERYQFLKWGQTAFRNFEVVPPGTGICHQVNLENIARSVWSSPDPSGELVAYPDTCVGTDSHTTMVNGLGVLGWGVGGIEAEAAMLGQPVSMLIPEVVGFKLTGALAEGITATDLVLTVTQMLRKKGVVGRFVEFYGPGVSELSLADRATIANMAPEYGATCGFFGIDDKTLDYLRLTGRPDANIALVEAYAKAQGLWLTAGDADPVFTDTLDLDMSSVQPSLAGPKRPQDKVLLSQVDEEFRRTFTTEFGHPAEELPDRFPVEDAGGGITEGGGGITGAIAGAIGGLLGRKPTHDLGHGDVVIAADHQLHQHLQSRRCWSPAGLVARKAREKGFGHQALGQDQPRARLQVVTDYLDRAGLRET